MSPKAAGEAEAAPAGPAASPAGSSTDVPVAVAASVPAPGESKGPVKSEAELAALRRQCKNTLQVVGAILSRPRMQDLVRGMCLLAEPFHTAHASHARDVRGPSASVAFYRDMARCAYLVPVKACLRSLDRLERLSWVGLETDFSAGIKATMPLDHHRIQEGDAFAQRLATFALTLVRNRCASMAWHSDYYPGRLALLLSDNNVEVAECVKEFRGDYAAWQKAQEFAPGNSVLAKCASSSCFRAAAIQGVADALCAATPEPEPDRVARATAIAHDIFAGFGQTKVVEDTFQVLRDRETRDVRNRTLNRARAWSVARGQGTLGLHNMEEIPGGGSDVPAHPKVSSKLFETKKHTPTVDISSLTRKLDWPTFSPQSQQALWAMRALLRHCHQNNAWEVASKTWLWSLAPLGTVLQRARSKAFYMSLGHVGFCALLAWPIVPTKIAPRALFFSLATADDQPKNLTWLHISDASEYVVYPCDVVGPLHLYVKRGCKLTPGVAVGWLQTADSMSLLRNAALNAFWDLPLPVVQRVATEVDVGACGPTLVEVLRALLVRVLGAMPPAELERLLSKRGIYKEEDVLAIGLDNDMFEGALGESDGVDAKEKQGRRRV